MRTGSTDIISVMAGITAFVVTLAVTFGLASPWNYIAALLLLSVAVTLATGRAKKGGM